VPIPGYLPSAHAIREIYYNLDLNASPQVTNILFLISDQPVQWVGTRYIAKLALEMRWNETGGGFKQIAGERIPTIPSGVLQDTDTQWVLWWENFSSPDGSSTLQLRASRQLPKDEWIQIAASTPRTMPISPVVPDRTTPAQTATPSPSPVTVPH
jgi:hypothetical protein